MSRCPDRKPLESRTAEVAKADGKAVGYADVGTMTWKKEAQVVI
jgi:hypothetical protein